MMRASFTSLVLAVACLPCACRHTEGEHAAGKTASASTTTSSSAAGTVFDEPAATPGAVTGTEGEAVTGSSAHAGTTTAKLARCGWGPSTATSPPDAAPWAIALVDVDLPDDVKGLHVTALELSDANGVVAKMGGRATLRFQEGAVSYSFGATETRDVAETLTAGPVRLRAAAVLDRPASAIHVKATRCSVVLTDASGQLLVASGNVDPKWTNE